MRLIRNILFIIIIASMPLIVVHTIGFILNLPFTLKAKYEEAVSIQEEFEETGRKLIEHN